MCADAPDMTAMNEAAKANADIAKEALAFYKQEYAKSAPEREAAAALATEQAGLQNQLSRQQLEMSQQERERYNATFKPIEERVAAEAMAYDTPERREAAASAAQADVEMAIAGQRQATMREMERRGALPGSGRLMAMSGMMDIGAAKVKAGAANTARQQVETLGAAKRMDAAGLGRGVVSNQATTAGIALNAGNSAVGNGQAPVNVAAAGAGLMGQGFQTGIQGNASAGQLYGQAANLQAGASAANGQAMAGVGSAIGGIAMAI